MQKVHQYNRICMSAKPEFLRTKIQEKEHPYPRTTQTLWQVLGDVLQRLPAKLLPSINVTQLLAHRFVEFFHEVEKIHSTFPVSFTPQQISPHTPPPTFFTFSTVTEHQVAKIIINWYKQVNNLALIFGPLYLSWSTWTSPLPHRFNNQCVT